LSSRTHLDLSITPRKQPQISLCSSSKAGRRLFYSSQTLHLLQSETRQDLNEASFALETRLRLTCTNPLLEMGRETREKDESGEVGSVQYAC
jgi:hypothetical protein